MKYFVEYTDEEPRDFMVSSWKARTYVRSFDTIEEVRIFIAGRSLGTVTKVIKGEELPFEVKVRIGEDEGVVPQNVPFIQVRPFTDIPPGEITITSGSCSKCGIDMSKPMGYACPNNDCPSIVKITNIGDTE